MLGAFSTHIAVRVYELDSNQHVNQAIYFQYAEHAFWEHLRAAGVTMEKMRASGAGPVYLEHTIQFRSELRAGDELDVVCGFQWGTGKTFTVSQRLVCTDGTVAAEMSGTAGVIDMNTRKLAADPAEHFRSLATKPELLDL
jgi:acyl-CoA thioester hydrolase